MNMNNGQWREHAMKAKDLAAQRFLRENCFANVVGVGIGKKLVKGKTTDTDCLRIYVQSKRELEDLSPTVALPSDFLGVPTDVIQIGRFGAGKKLMAPQRKAPGSPIRLDSNRSNVSPASVGTLGAVVEGGKSTYILSCNHVLAWNGRASALPDAKPEEPALKVVSGALGDPGKDVLADSDRFVEIRRDKENSVDCALAIIADGNVSSAFPEDVGQLGTKPIEPKLDMSVVKYGAATHRTEGKIVDIDADFFIDYTFGTFRFTNQVVIDSGADGVEFAADGDSGSIVLDTEGKCATAMVFAEAGRYAVACKLPTVFEELNVELVLASQVEVKADARTKAPARKAVGKTK